MQFRNIKSCQKFLLSPLLRYFSKTFATKVTNSNKKKKHVTRKKTQRWQKRSRRIISNHPAYHPWLTLYIWRYIGLTLDRIARWRKPVHVIRVEFNFLRTRDARVAHRAWVCVHTRVYSRVIRTTRWKRMDKEGRGQEPWTTFRLPIRVRSIHVASRLIQELPIFPFIRIFAGIRKIYVCGSGVTRVDF